MDGEEDACSTFIILVINTFISKKKIKQYFSFFFGPLDHRTLDCTLVHTQLSSPHDITLQLL